MYVDENYNSQGDGEDLDYESATDNQKKEMWIFSHDTTEQATALTDYHYIGKDPNNYIIFNNELWRIIGVFDIDDRTDNVEKNTKDNRKLINRKIPIGY